VDPLTVLLQLAFYATFAVSVARLIQRRGPLELSIVAVFTPMAALFLLSFVNSIDKSLTPIARPLLITLLFLQPYFVVRLIDQIRPISTRTSRLVLLGSIVSALLIAFGPTPGIPLVVLAAVSYFGGVQAAAAGRLLRDSRRRFGVARFRLILAASATASFGAAILLAGAASAANGGTSNASMQILTRTLALLAGLGYLVAFVPPSWLRRMAYRAMAFDLVRNLVAPPTGTGAGRLWGDLAAAAREFLGARSVVILAEPTGLPLASAGELSGIAALGAAAAASRDRHGSAAEVEAHSESGAIVSRIEVPLRGRDSNGEHLVAEIEGRPLFVEDDIALLELLGSLTARAVDREEALISLGQARHALEESAAIRASEARFRALLDAEPNAILALDENDTVTWATRQAGELFGTAAEALAGRPLADLVAMPHELREATALGRPVYRAETTGRRADGTHFPAEMARTDFVLDDRPFQLAVLSDITWRHEADQIRERFLGVLSHELRTPVTSIYGGTQLLLGRGARLDEATRTELLVSVAAESERLQRMIENLVALARIERGAEFTGTRPVLIDRTIGELINRERPLWPEITIKLDIPAPVQMVGAEEEYLAQIMRNLLSNAAKYSGPGSTVEVTVADAGPEVVILVQDDGPGVNDDEAEKLFSLYYRASHQAASAPGAGIGLFVCRELVGMMGGRIWARSRPGGGAEFGFSLPAYAEEDEDAFEGPRIRQVDQVPPVAATA
jgi:PAS domain S-box-containing protein